jgi:hypothetical protein
MPHAIEAQPDAGLVSAANRYLHASGGRDEIRATQVRTYLRWIGAHPADHPTVRALRRSGLDLADMAAVPGRRTEPVLARIDREFVRWAQARQAAGEDFPKSHVWIRGFVATVLAVERRDRAGHQLRPAADVERRRLAQVNGRITPEVCSVRAEWLNVASRDAKAVTLRRILSTSAPSTEGSRRCAVGMSPRPSTNSRGQWR